MSVCNWSIPQDLEMLQERIQRLIRECYPADPVQEQLFDTGEPGAGYVDQGKGI
jgi:hypothetical protein